MPKGTQLRQRSGPGHQKGAREHYERVLLGQLLATVQPTGSEMRTIRRALERWGLTDPTPHEIMGDHPRPGLESILSLMAGGA